jgi:hypothetical protein
MLRATLAAVLVAAVAVAGVSGPADATDISIPFDDLVFGQPGSTVDIATVDVSAEMVGRTCHLAVLAENQSSVHIGNDLIVSTGGSQAVIFGVEDTPNGGTSETYEMVVGPTILVQLRIGQDGMSSLGFDLSFDCVNPVVEATTTSTIAQQQLATTTTATATSSTDCSDAAAGQTGTTTTVAGQAGGVTEGCTPDCSGAGSGTDGGTTSTTVAGQATTETTVCGSAQVTSATTSTAVTPTVAGSSTNQLPETPAAQAVTGSPSYTG